MARLIDKLIFEGARFAGETLDKPAHWPFSPDQNMPEIFDISNVTDYFAQTQQEKKQAWLLEDFPNVAPPFQFFWMEYRRPANAFKAPTPNHVPIRRAGALMESITERQARVMLEEPDADCDFLEDQMNPMCNLNYTDAHWIIDCTLFVEHDNNITELERSFLLLDAEGAVIDNAVRAKFGQGFDYTSKGRESLKQALAEGRYAVCYPALLALSFLHCSNVSTIENKADAKLQRARERRNKPPLLTYKTLRIEPMTKVLHASSGRSGETDLKQSLHICRGHFKHFGEKYKNKKTGEPCKKLFGKIEGSFFIPQMVRGHSEAGVIVKDYAVDSGER